MASSDLFSSHPLPFSVAEPKAPGEQFVQPWCAHRRAFRLALFPMGPDSSPASPLISATGRQDPIPNPCSSTFDT